ncbi:conserved hypothetical protein [Desulfosarcina cetonica]|uniref:Rossmann-like domain-containing protein n=1 Tax=Desulfosarcina cetonica TaxID=90730 RepID=UPI0006D19EA0|nr:DUF364 domain-containing protein [Desulfosarcina cetonica]VTR70053.1 conserved hypothetical protein [Desulfosarcina cetonica]
MFSQLKSSFIEMARESGLMETEVNITARQLTPGEAIGETERKDFPLLQGRESLMQAEFKGAMGQAFTDMPMNFKGKVKDIVEIKLRNNGERALFISALNAVMRHLGKADKTIHCKNDEPELCAREIAESVINQYGTESHIGIIGFQPAIIDNFSKLVSPEKVRVTDLDRDNIGKKKYGIFIWDGKTMEEEIFKASDVLLATGSTIVNNSLEKLTIYAEKYNKPIYFYGTTIAGPAVILNLKRLCFNAA